MNEWCKQELVEIDSEIQSGSSPANTSTDGSAQQQPARHDAQAMEHLKQAARILGDRGRNDACRMVLFEMREMLRYDGSKGTNSP